VLPRRQVAHVVVGTTPLERANRVERLDLEHQVPTELAGQPCVDELRSVAKHRVDDLGGVGDAVEGEHALIVAIAAGAGKASAPSSPGSGEPT